MHFGEPPQSLLILTSNTIGHKLLSLFESGKRLLLLSKIQLQTAPVSNCRFCRERLCVMLFSVPIPVSELGIGNIDKSQCWGSWILVALITRQSLDRVVERYFGCFFSLQNVAPFLAVTCGVPFVAGFWIHHVRNQRRGREGQKGPTRHNCRGTKDRGELLLVRLMRASAAFNVTESGMISFVCTRVRRTLSRREKFCRKALTCSEPTSYFLKGSWQNNPSGVNLMVCKQQCFLAVCCIFCSAYFL